MRARLTYNTAPKAKAQHIGGQDRVACDGLDRLAEGIDRAGADVALDDPDSPEGEGRAPLPGRAVGFGQGVVVADRNCGNVALERLGTSSL